MPGVRRTAVAASAFLLVSAAWATAQSPQEHALPAGHAVVFVTDAELAPNRREGDVVTVHLRDPITLDGTVLAAAGTRAVLLVGATGLPDGTVRPVITLARFSITPGLLPVRAARPIVAPVPAGTEIAAVTLAEVDHIGNRFSIVTPFPFRLSGDRPASAYTPTPARTPPPALPRPGRNGRGTPPPPTPVPTDTPFTPPPATLAPDATPVPLPPASAQPHA